MRLFATPWPVACQAPLPVGFSGQEYGNGLLFPSLESLPDPGIEPGSLALQAESLPSELPGKLFSPMFCPKNSVSMNTNFRLLNLKGPLDSMWIPHPELLRGCCLQAVSWASQNSFFCFLLSEITVQSYLLSSVWSPCFMPSANFLVVQGARVKPAFTVATTRIWHHGKLPSG